MTATPESTARTRAFARVIGLYLVLVPVIVAVRAPNIRTILSDFFENEALVWISGALLLFAGLAIIAFHQYWSTASAALISLFGWFLAIRGLMLLTVPQMMKRGTEAAMSALPLVRLGFLVLALVGLWLTYVGWLAKPPALSAEEHVHES